MWTELQSGSLKCVSIVKFQQIMRKLLLLSFTERSFKNVKKKTVKSTHTHTRTHTTEAYTFKVKLRHL